jgi:sec-independent protein translocase protein TatA
MLGLRMPELLVIGLIVLLLFGPGKLAGLGEGLGRGIRDFKKAMAGEDEKPSQAAPADAQRAPDGSPKPGTSGDGRGA